LMPAGGTSNADAIKYSASSIIQMRSLSSEISLR
jgi:hypothetical protein